MKRILFFSFFLLILLSFFSLAKPKSAKACCDPAECGTGNWKCPLPGGGSTCPEGSHCQANTFCCIPDNTPTPGPGQTPGPGGPGEGCTPGNCSGCGNPASCPNDDYRCQKGDFPGCSYDAGQPPGKRCVGTWCQTSCGDLRNRWGSCLNTKGCTWTSTAGQCATTCTGGQCNDSCGNPISCTPPPGTIQGAKRIMPGSLDSPITASQIVNLDTKTSEVILRAQGTPGAGIYPNMQLRINGTSVNNWTVTGSWVNYTANTVPLKAGDTLQAWFTNDYYGGPTNDRNLFVDSITINGVTIYSNNSNRWDNFVTITYDPAAPMKTCGFVDGSKSTTNLLACQSYFTYTMGNPYFMYNVSAASHTVSVSVPVGYSVASTLCYNRTDCHTDSCATGGSCPVADAYKVGTARSVNVPSGGYADLWWHYTGLPAGAWWQVKDADVTTNGSLTSSIPLSGTAFDLDGGGGYPGIPSYTGSYKFTSGSGLGTVSSKGWIVDSPTNYKKIYDYSFFKSQIPPDVQAATIEINSDSPWNCSAGNPSGCSVSGGNFQSLGTPTKGYVWFHYDGAEYGDLTINSAFVLNGTRKVVLLVEGANLTIGGKININQKGQGFFMAVVGKDANGQRGNISIDPTVSHSIGQGNPSNSPDLEGIFFAEGEVKTGAGDNPLYIRGSVAALGGISLERDLTDNSTTPAEFFEYAPEMQLIYPNIFKNRRMRWKEVSP